MNATDLAEVLRLHKLYLAGDPVGKPANLGCANLGGANLRGATMPDGRLWEDYAADPLAGICDEPEARARAIGAWGMKTWQTCPMHAAHGWGGIDDAPGDKRRAVACFIAVHDAGLLPVPAKATP